MRGFYETMFRGARCSLIRGVPLDNLVSLVWQVLLLDIFLDILFQPSPYIYSRRNRNCWTKDWCQLRQFLPWNFSHFFFYFFVVVYLRYSADSLFCCCLCFCQDGQSLVRLVEVLRGATARQGVKYYTALYIGLFSNNRICLYLRVFDQPFWLELLLEYPDRQNSLLGCMLLLPQELLEVSPRTRFSLSRACMRRYRIPALAFPLPTRLAYSQRESSRDIPRRFACSLELTSGIRGMLLFSLMCVTLWLQLCH